jgi:hypothetical protein
VADHELGVIKKGKLADPDLDLDIRSGHNTSIPRFQHLFNPLQCPQ